MLPILNKALSIFLCTAALTAFAQRGPGGVSTESGSQSTCRIWLDANTLTSLADGDDLTSWPDVSLSNVNDDATPPGSALPPFFRDDAANTINGYPVVTFEENRYLKLAPSTDLNLQTITYSKTIFFAFRTSTDVTSEQVIYEEGGGWRGLNIHLKDGEVIVGAYDLNNDGFDNNGTTKDSDGTPQWGYTYVSTPIQANSTNILTIQFKALATGTVQANSNYYIKGWLNGQVFDVMQLNDADHTVNGNNGIGTLFEHPDDIGLGAVNGDFVDKTSDYDNQDGIYSFQGRLAELCYYNDLLNDTERIILENYLGAKYFANIIVNDRYDYQGLYGNEVMGIGQQTNSAANRHSVSQARNPFEISVSSTSSYNAAQQYFFTGHNGANLIWTSNGVPNNSVNIRRLQRIWRGDRTNLTGNIKFKIKTNDLPPAPAGFTKLVLLVDETSVNFPNFTLPTTKVREITHFGGINYEINYNLPDGAFYTLAWLKPEVSFTVSEASAVESDSPPATSPYSVAVILNYQPNPGSPATVVDYSFVDQTTEPVPTDYDYNATAQANGFSIPSGSSSANLPFDIVNDLIPDDESTESFLIILQNGANTTPGLQIGERDTLIFSILDDDPPPAVSFVGTGSSVLETAGEFYIKVRRSGNSADMASTASTIRVRRRLSPNEGTALYNTDYSLTSADGWQGISTGRYHTVVFPAAFVTTQLDSVRVTLTDDIIDEDDETANFNLLPLANAAVTPSSVVDFSLTIVDDDPLPQANFLSDNQTGYESVGDPLIFVELDRPSTRDVEIDYIINTAAGTATNGIDYTGSIAGTMLFMPGDTLAYPTPFNVDNGDASGEPDETVVFEITGGLNGSTGPINTHTYTIIDTSPFEWKGAAGVGKNSDNIVWIDANRMSPLGPKSSINNFSPRDIDIIRSNGDNNRASLIANAINGRQALDFDGSSSGSTADGYQIDDNSFINLAGFMEKKAFFFVVKPDVVPSVSAGSGTTPNTSHARLIYEQGGTTRGIAIYLYLNRLYFHAWNDANDGPESPWGYNSGAAGGNDGKVASTVWARSSDNIVAGNTYIISCIYDNGSTEPLMVWINGKKGEMSPNITAPNDVGRLYIHSGDVGLGFPLNQCRFHFTTKDASDRSCAFDGLIAEFIKFHEPQMNEARRTIIENYLSAKYNIPLFNADTRQIFDLTNANASSGDPLFNKEVAGVGRFNLAQFHGDAQGTAILRIKNPIFSSTTGFLEWGHNGVDLLTTYPYSYNNAELPGGIEERSGKVWKLFESPNGSISSADFYINFTASASAGDFNLDDTLLKLLVHSNSDEENFSNATVYDVTEIRSGNVAYFQNIPVSNGMYFTLGNTSPINISPLPITLLNFDAKLISEFVDVTWSTASEINNEFFVVERADKHLRWEPIIQIDGAGNSNSRIDYSEKDRNPLQGVSYYRLKQIDFDGKFSYSDVVSVVNTNIADNDAVLMFPNPSRTGSVFLRIPPAFAKLPTQVSIFDLTGKEVWKGIYSPDSDIAEINFGELRKGIYLVNINSELINETKKLVVD